MTEEKITHLFQASASLDINKYPILKSQYLIKSYEVTRGYGLPSKEFSLEKRCPHCFLTWSPGMYETKVVPIKNTKKRKRKNKSSNLSDNNDSRRCTQLERTCSFCKKITMIPCPKPSKVKDETNARQKNSTAEEQKVETKVTSNNKKNNIKKEKPVNVYTNTRDIFSLSNQKNNLDSGKITKVVKNNKKKKDKYAGLCQAAVLSSAKFKEMKEQSSTNNLHLFLKPSK